MRKAPLAAAALWIALAPLGALAADPVRSAVLYKNPACSCCDGHADYLRQNGFTVEVIETPELDKVKAEHGVPEGLAGCHTILIDGYVVEGHVPVGPSKGCCPSDPISSASRCRACRSARPAWAARRASRS